MQRKMTVTSDGEEMEDVERRKRKHATDRASWFSCRSRLAVRTRHNSVTLRHRVHATR